MNPYLDEQSIVTTSNIFQESVRENFKISIEREAYGPTQNKGLCFEILFKICFQSSYNIDLYLGLDGYTKILLIPYLTNKFNLDLEEENIGHSALLHFSEYLGEFMAHELETFITDIKFMKVLPLHHQIIELSELHLRKYMLIFNLTDKTKNLGRSYLILTIKKK